MLSCSQRFAVALSCLLLAPVALAQNSANPRLPPGHPPTGMTDSPSASTAAPDPAALPPGHPPTGTTQQPSAAPRGWFQPKPDRIVVDTALASGTIILNVVDADDQGIDDIAVTLTIISNSVSRGEQTSHQEGTTDAHGKLRFDKLGVGTTISYQLTAHLGPARFRTRPFSIKSAGAQGGGGIRALLHAYEATTDLAHAAIIMEAVLMLEIKQDTLSISHRIRTLNVGKRAFVPTDVSMKLPDDYRAFNKQDSDLGMEMVEQNGRAALVGTFPPGQSELVFSYQVPLSGSASQLFSLPIPPRVMHTTVLLGGAKQVGLSIEGFPTATHERARNGSRILKAIRQASMQGGFESLLKNTDPDLLKITVSGIPTPGLGPMVALLLAMATVAGAGYSFFRRDSSPRQASRRAELQGDLIEGRNTMLADLTLLERLHRAGKVGPKSYQRLRKALVGSLAIVLQRLDATGYADDANRQGGKSPTTKRRKARKRSKAHA